MDIKILPLLILFAVVGCHSVHVSEQMAADLPIVKAKVIQLRRDMKRDEVEKILNPFSRPVYGYCISGHAINEYEVMPGIWVQLPFSCSTDTLLNEPVELVLMDNQGQKAISLSKIK